MIDAREPIQRTIRYTGMYSGGQSANSGYEVRLVVRPLASDASSPADRARLIRVGEVTGALEAKLMPPATAVAGN